MVSFVWGIVLAIYVERTMAKNYIVMARGFFRLFLKLVGNESYWTSVSSYGKRKHLKELNYFLKGLAMNCFQEHTFNPCFSKGSLFFLHNGLFGFILCPFIFVGIQIASWAASIAIFVTLITIYCKMCLELFLKRALIGKLNLALKKLVLSNLWSPSYTI